MNVLAKEQKKLLDSPASAEERTERERRFLKRYNDLRHKAETGFLGRMSLRTRKRLHSFVVTILSIKNRLGGFSYEFINDKRTPTDRPIILAITHIGKFDIEVVSEAIKDHCYILTGDFEHIQGTVEALFLAVNGVFYFNERVREERALVKERMIRHLKEGGNILYFPEGAWNMTPNLPMLPCFWGIVEIAQQGNAVVIPVAVDQYGKQFKISIGSNFDMLNYGTTEEERARAITDLRDMLSALKWEIWETESQKRCELKGDEWEKYCADRFKEWPYFNFSYIEELIFKPKGTDNFKDVFSHLQTIRLNPNRENAFFLDKHISDV